MAILQHYRTTYVDYIRSIIGDPDGLLFSTDELISYLDRWSSRTLSGATIRAENNKYYLNSCSSGMGVRDLEVTTGVDLAVYVIDEQAEVVLFDPDDPENTAVAPNDGDTIDVSYYEICTAKLVSDLFMTLSSNHTKLVAAQSIVGVSIDLTKLADAFYQQAVRWEVEA